MSKNKADFDFLVIGGGVAGLTFALNAAKHGTVAVLFKKSTTESSTAWAQGGIAAVRDQQNDSFDLHLEDTIKAGAGLVNPEVARIVIEEGPAEVERLIEYGADFDKAKNSENYNLHQEGGHSRRRILHNADATGWEIQKTLLAECKKHPSIQFLSDHNAINLITTKELDENVAENRILGAYVLTPEENIITITAHQVLVSTGGAGKVYLYTSNPDVATGDGIAMCYRAGCAVANMEFFQFHPTCLYHPQAKSFLITEAMRGEGGILTRINGERFMPKYSDQAELAPRDIVARAIDHEMKKYGEDHVYLDIRHRGADFVKDHFPTIYERCLEYGIDITQEPIPVVPAAHYCCGGVVCNEHGETAVSNLYVAGEVSYTGLHGANRLASNSLLEGLVYGKRAAEKAVSNLNTHSDLPDIPSWNSGNATDLDEAVVISQNWDEIRRFMWNYVGIFRSDKRLKRALERSNMLTQEIRQYYWDFKLTPDLLELRNLNLVANLVIRSALMREESRGLHYNIDHPEPSEQFLADTVIHPDS